jgi:hypothetical protein
MNTQELQEIVLQNQRDITSLRQQVTEIRSKEQRVERVLQDLHRRLRMCLDSFDRDQYKATDQ